MVLLLDGRGREEGVRVSKCHCRVEGGISLLSLSLLYPVSFLSRFHLFIRYVEICYLDGKHAGC